MDAAKYTYRLKWSAEDQLWAGVVLEFPSLSYLSPTIPGAREGIRLIVADVLQDMAILGEEPPAPGKVSA